MKGYTLAFLAAGIVLPCLANAATLKISPTTTLGALRATNTSASPNFISQSNGNLGSSKISKVDIHSLLYPGAQTKIFAHLMLWFGQSSHMNVGYTSTDPAQVKRQITDMISRGIDGVVMDWYGPNNAIDQAAKLVMYEAETHPGFTFAIMVDSGAIRRDSCSGCDPEQALVQDLQYVEQTYFPSPAYLRVGGRPVVTNFDIDLHYQVDWTAARAGLATDPLFLFQNGNGFSHLISDGSYSWDIPTSSDRGMSYLTGFYETGMRFPGKQTWGTAYKGFNDQLASWGLQRSMAQQCGQTWLQTFSKINRLYNSANPLPAVQLVTWNDYEEGTEIESGIDNCVSLSASLATNWLQWSVSGNENTIDHYTVYISADGKNLMPLVNMGTGSHSLEMCSYSLGSGPYILRVQAVGKPNLRNQLSGPVRYVPNCRGTPSAGVTVSSPHAGATVQSPVRFTGTAGTTPCSSGVASMGVYINDKLTSVVNGMNLNMTLSLRPGRYKTAVQEWDFCGGSSFATVPITVANRN